MRCLKSESLRNVRNELVVVLFFFKCVVLTRKVNIHTLIVAAAIIHRTCPARVGSLNC